MGFMTCSAAHQQSNAEVLASLLGVYGDVKLSVLPSVGGNSITADIAGTRRYRSFLGCYGGESVNCINNVNSTVYSYSVP